MWGVWNKVFLCITLAAFCAVGSACWPARAVSEKPVTQAVTQPADQQTKVEARAETTVVVTEQETVQVVVTSTPTPIPEGGYITRAAFTDAQTANPILAADNVSRAFCDLMFKGLLDVDPFTGELTPGFAQGWSVSGDGLTYTFTLREGLTWSDGEPITAWDFWFSYAALQSGELDTPNTTLAAQIDQIEVIDDLTAQVIFHQADCGNLETLRLGWIPMHVFTDDADAYEWSELAEHEFNSTPTAFSGPFMLQEWVRGDHWIQVRNERYWRGSPHLEGVITRVLVGQTELVDLLKSGEIDIAQAIKPQYLDELEQQTGIEIWKFLADEYDFVALQLGDPTDPQPGLNEDGTANKQAGRHPILADRRVRQAISTALDRDELIDGARVGQGIPLHANVLPMVSWAYNTELDPSTAEPEQAGLLLDKAGWELNTIQGIRQKDGKALELDLYTNTGNTVREIMAAQIKEQLAEINIQVNVITLPWPQFLEVLYGQTFDMALVNWSNLGVNPDDTRLWHSRQDVPGDGDNFVSYNNPKVEEMLDKARQATGCDLDVRSELYRQIQAQLAYDQPYVWIDVPRNLVAVSSQVGGHNLGPWNTWHDVHQWYVTP